MADDKPEDAEKEHLPSEKRLADARKNGEVARSLDLSTAASYLGLIVACWAGATIILAATGAWQVFLEQAAMSGSAREAVGNINPWALVAATVVPVLLLLLGPGAFSLACLFAQKAVVFAPSKLKVKWSRISPLATAQQKFGRDGLVEFGKNTAKLFLFSGLLGSYLATKMNAIIGTSLVEPRLGLAFLVSILGQFLFIATLISTVVGGLDFVWQRHALIRRNRMTRREMLDEHKDSEGDAHAKSVRKQRGQEIAMNQMLGEVAKASVVIVNPTHYAVAIKWQRGDLTPPLVVAKGTDDVARKIREAARAAGVPVHSDPPTARAIHASTQVGKPISREHFAAVAAAIRFAEKLRRKSPGRS